MENYESNVKHEYLSRIYKQNLYQNAWIYPLLKNLRGSLHFKDDLIEGDESYDHGKWPYIVGS